MSRKSLLVVGGLALLAAVLWLWSRAAPQSVRPKIAGGPKPPSPQQALYSPINPVISKASSSAEIRRIQAERRQETAGRILGILATPITFYGKVIDQNGDPIADASVDYGTIDKFDADGSNYRGKTDTNGYFSVSGIQGAVLTVGVSKTGYYNIHGKSDGAFAYGVGPDSTRKEPPTKDRPAVFVLQKMGVTEPLVRVSSRQINIPATGQPTSIDLTTGRTGRGNVQLESWIGDSSQRRFDWWYRLSVPGGGLIERQGQFEFEAPVEGYQASIETSMAASADKWSSDVNKSYFARLADGRYARFSINFYPGKRNFVVLESYVNPTPGDRNLEFDPKKEIKGQ
jgi:hypothetical protein